MNIKKLAGLLSVTAVINSLPLLADDLAKQSQNPLAAMSTMLFDFRYEKGAGPEDAGDNILELKPVVPIEAGEDVIIARAIVPLIDQGARYQGQGSESGMGDINLQAYWVPKPTGSVTWGVGPSVMIPTHSDDRLGQDNWSAGPAVAVITMPGNWLVGALAQNLWDVHSYGDDEDVNSFLLQYFINYNFDNGWYATSTPVITADWEADSDDRWRIPFGGGVGKVVRWGGQAIDLKLQAYKYVERPENSADWSVQFNFKLLFPRG